MDEREILNAWRHLFGGKEVTPEILEKAEELLSDLNGESPLHLRLQSELKELTSGPAEKKKKRPVSRQAK